MEGQFTKLKYYSAEIMQTHSKVYKWHRYSPDIFCWKLVLK